MLSNNSTALMEYPAAFTKPHREGSYVEPISDVLAIGGENSGLMYSANPHLVHYV
jgi:hypothetical protein